MPDAPDLPGALPGPGSACRPGDWGRVLCARPAAFYLLLALVLHLDGLLFGPWALVRLHDVYDASFVHFREMGRLLSEHGLFFWFPAVGAGAPAFAAHHPPYHPFSFLARFVPLWALSLAAETGLAVLAGTGMRRLLRRVLGLEPGEALLGGALFVLATVHVIPHFVFVHAFPAFFTAFLSLADRRLGIWVRVRRTAFCLMLCLLSYPVLTLPHFAILHCGLVLVLAGRLASPGRALLAAVAFWGGYALFFTPVIVALFEYIPLAQRSYSLNFPGVPAALLAAGKRFFAALGQDQAAAALALAGLPAMRISRTVRRLFLFTLAVASIHALAVSPLKALAADTLLAKMDLGNIERLLTPLEVLFGCLALSRARAAGLLPEPWQALAAVAVLAPFYSAQHVLSAGLFLLLPWLAATVPPEAAAGAWARRPRLARVAPVLFAAGLGLAGMLALQQTWLSYSHVPYAKGYGERPLLNELARTARRDPFRVACVDVHPSVAQAAGLEVVEGKAVLFNKHFKGLMRAVLAPQLADPESAKRFDGDWYHIFLGNPDSRRTHYLEFFPGRTRTSGDWNLSALALLNVRYLISARPLDDPGGLLEFVGQDLGAGLPSWLPAGVRRFEEMPLWVYRLKAGLGRAWMAGAARVWDTQAQVVEALAATPLGEAGQTLHLTAREAGRAGIAGHPGGEAREDVRPVSRLEAATPDYLRIGVQAPAGGWLLVSMNHDPHWRARVDGREAPVIRGDVALAAVPVAPGSALVELRFEAPDMVWWHLAALFGLAVMVLAPGRCGGLGALAPDGEPEPVFVRAGAGVACMAAGSAVLVWAAFYVPFVYFRGGDPQKPLGYVLVAAPLIGALLSGLGLALWSVRDRRK